MTIRPIRTDADHRAALKEIERLWNPAPGTPEEDELDILATLVDAYESKRWPTEAGDPVDMVHFAIADMGRTQAELAALIGSRSRASEILNRKRHLTVEMIRKLTDEWGLPAESLIRPYRLNLNAA